MRTQRARDWTLGLVVLFCATIACGARGPVAPAPLATITLTDTACVADGLGALIPAHFVATLVNNTSYEARYTLQRMNDGHAYQELELHIAEQQRRFLAETAQLNPPTFTSIATGTVVSSMQTGHFDENLSSGTYGLVCRGVKTPDRWTAYVVGPLRVP